VLDDAHAAEGDLSVAEIEAGGWLRELLGPNGPSRLYELERLSPNARSA
jgi:hypothetical protein